MAQPVQRALFFCVIAALAAGPAFAAVSCPPTSPWPPSAGPIVKTVPWIVPQAPLCIITPHDILSGQVTTLKATTDTTASQYYWDYGDGSSVMPWTNVADAYNIGVTHTYTGNPGTAFVATVYVKNAAGTINSNKYFLAIRPSNLDVRSNIAIDKALWKLHRSLRQRGGSGSALTGYWNSGDTVSGGYVGNNAANTTAFLVNGHQPDSDPANPNPYAETVLRGMNATLLNISRTNIPASVTNARGTFNPDQNGNGYGVLVPESEMYEGGMVMDMIAATGQPGFVASVGGPGIIGQTLSTIGQDMFDFYTYCQTVGRGSYNGGWRYGCRYSDSDNSVCQWAAIGMMGLKDKFGFNYPPPIPGPGTSPVLLANMDWLNYSFNPAGVFGYTDPCCNAWGWDAVTPSGMVQMAMTGQTRGAPGGAPTKWDKTESWVRANFTGPLNYYYGLFSFTKSMLQNPAGPLHTLCGRDANNFPINCIDWYYDATLGVGTTLVNTQGSDGDWWCHEYTGTQCYFETAWATIMLNRTVYSSGLPVAVIDASPTTTINGATVNFTGKNSVHQDPTKQIVLWEWDFSGTGSGAFSASGVNQNNVVIHTGLSTFPVSFPVRLRVTDNTTPVPQTAISTVVITITNPPFPPTANAGGPYSICPQTAYLPFHFDGTKSKDGTNGGHITGAPPNTITKFEWDLLGNGSYAQYPPTPAQPRVDTFYSTAGLLGSGATILVNLRVTDNSALSYPPSPNLTATASTQVVLRQTNDVLCSKCVSSAQAIGHGAVPGKAAYIALLWVETGAHHYNIYRGMVNGGPYTMIGTVTNTVLNTGKTLAFGDSGPLTAGVTYYYRIAPATISDVETCISNQATTSGSIPRAR